MIDIVANLIEVDKEYETAFEVILSGRSQNIVTVDTDTAKYSVNILKNEDLGRATFLPLDILQIRPILENPHLSRHPGFVGYAAELVKVNEEFSKLPLYLFTDTIIVNTLEDGLELRKNYDAKNQIVSLDGQIIASRGAITGGSAKFDERASILSRNRRLHEVDELIDSLQNKLNTIQKGEKKIITAKQEATSLKIGVEAELNDLMMKNASIKRTLSELNSLKNELDREIKELQMLQIDYSSKIAGSEARKENVSEEISILKADLEMMKEKGNVDYVYNAEEKTLVVTIIKLNMCRAVKPRYSTDVSNIDKYLRRFLPSRNFGSLIISTSKGLMTHQDAVANKIGGSLIAYFY